VNSLKRLVDVLCSPFFTTVLDKGIDLLVRPKGIHWCTLLLIVIAQPFPCGLDKDEPIISGNRCFSPSSPLSIEQDQRLSLDKHR
jgi:hypothetical protein